MNETTRSGKGWRILRRILIGLAIFATLIAIFYTEENWRGKRAWEQCKRELEAKGVVLDWNKYIPAPVPDDQNFFKAPKMAEWFAKPDWGHSRTNELTERLKNSDTTATITNETAAAKYLAWSDQFEPDFDNIREALKRPYAIIPGDYSQPFFQPIPDWTAMRSVVQTLAQRARCQLLLGQPDKALRELTLMRDLCRILERPPYGQPVTLVEAMINVAITGRHAETVADGFKSNAWQEPQMAALQEQLKVINLLPKVADAFNWERAATTHTFETTPAYKIADLVSGAGSSGAMARVWTRFKSPMYLLLKFAPRGWIYQNLANFTGLMSKPFGCIDLERNTLSPHAFDKATLTIDQFFARKSPFKTLASRAVPNFTKPAQTLAYNQTLVNEAQIVCALERYRLTHYQYPESLEALVPQLIEKLPRDVINGGPLHYRRMDSPPQSSGAANGKFLLYSVGWNETDDGGEVALIKDGSEDREEGDWVWKN